MTHSIKAIERYYDIMSSVSKVFTFYVDNLHNLFIIYFINHCFSAHNFSKCMFDLTYLFYILLPFDFFMFLNI